MPCGDTDQFPSAAFTKIGNAILNRQLTRDLIPACGDIACFVNAKIPGGDGPIPFPKPTFGAGLHSPDGAELDELARVMLDAATWHDAHAVGFSPLAALPWGKILGVLGTVFQGIFLALGDSRFPTKPDSE